MGFQVRVNLLSAVWKNSLYISISLYSYLIDFWAGILCIVSKHFLKASRYAAWSLTHCYHKKYMHFLKQKQGPPEKSLNVLDDKSYNSWDEGWDWQADAKKMLFKVIALSWFKIRLKKGQKSKLTYITLCLSTLTNSLDKWW